VPSAATAQDHKGHAWSYAGDDGPAHWGDLDPEFSACKLGQRQSPIDIRMPKKAQIPALQFDYKPVSLHIVNNGHTIQVNYAPGSFLTVGDKRYELRQFHFHHPSEEKVYGRHFPMVAHLVHADSEGQLAVVAIPLAAGHPNSLIDSVWKHIPQQLGVEQVIEYVQINIADLLPIKHGYYTFSGSLTTPPCSENVTWFVLKMSASITKEQASTFAKLYPHNARPIQPLNGREVDESQ
jgi:carbonic anhydrase